MLNNAQFQRIASNYLRMIITFVIGIWLLRIFLGFGEGVYAVIALTGSSIGIAEILKQIVRGATVPELGNNYHSKNDKHFCETYASTLVLSLISACFSVLILGSFIVFIDSFNIPENLVEATEYYIATRIIYVFLSITASPILNMMPITGRMMSYNLWQTADRASDLVSALIAGYLLFSQSGADQLIMFSTISLVLKLIVLFFAVIWTVRFEEKFIPNFRAISISSLKSTGRLIGWNTAAVISVNLYLRFDIIAVNLLYGIKATVIFGLASQLAAYVNVSAMGFISGLDSVVTQRAKKGHTKQKYDAYLLSINIVELQALVLGFVFTVLTLHTDYIIGILFADRINVDIDVSMIVICFFMLMSGMIARGLSEGWMSILTGLGNIKSYAVPLLLGAMLNPILVVIVGHFYELGTGLYYICLIFLILNIFFHMHIVPKVTAHALGVKTTSIINPILTPVVLTFSVIIIAYITGHFIDNQFVKLLSTIAIASLTIGVYFLIRFAKFLVNQSSE